MTKVQVFVNKISNKFYIYYFFCETTTLSQLKMVYGYHHKTYLLQQNGQYDSLQK